MEILRFQVNACLVHSLEIINSNTSANSLNRRSSGSNPVTSATTSHVFTVKKNANTAIPGTLTGTEVTTLSANITLLSQSVTDITLNTYSANTQNICGVTGSKLYL